MVSLTHARLWLVVLLAPVSWSAALGVLFSLTNETCISGSRDPALAVACAAVLLAALPAAPAWLWRRQVANDSPPAERTRFLLELATGGSVLFTLVTILTAIPVVFLDPCRT
jgi:hypothetical protein